MKRLKIDTQALIDRMKQEVEERYSEQEKRADVHTSFYEGSEYERSLREKLADIENAREKRRAEQQAAAERRANAKATELMQIETGASGQAAYLVDLLEGNTPPSRVAHWLRMDCWPVDDGLLLLCGLIPVADGEKLGRRQREWAQWNPASPPPTSIFGALQTVHGLCFWRDYRVAYPEWRSYRSELLKGLARKHQSMREIWDSGIHPDQVGPSYFLEWARAKRFHVDWAEWADEEGLLKNTGIKEIGDTERANLQKQIAAMALVLAEKSGKYRKGERPNVSQIAEAVDELLSALPDANSRGVGKSNVRANISAGLNLLNS
ncbi:hypothetical protein PIN31115_02821 [Pandoraea iniqua]|uniref:Uncharacterized protein n=1 Tax=Pandoraea iniqua TaxID=2508288 RepID=A0A5E4VUC0_9BURK|nr:hypothetical protein [Pandoraea iniqua]VVE14884.1 hypothetical protein PIN31115_02821 [Pandoraea iniqua]